MLASIHNFVYLSFWTIFVWKLKIQYGAHFPWRPETRNKNSTGEKIDVKEEEIFKKRLYLCSHSLYCEKGFGREEDFKKLDGRWSLFPFGGTRCKRGRSFNLDKFVIKYWVR